MQCHRAGVGVVFRNQVKNQGLQEAGFLVSEGRGTYGSLEDVIGLF